MCVFLPYCTGVRIWICLYTFIDKSSKNLQNIHSDLDSNLQRVDFYKGKESDLKTQSTQPSHVFIPLSSYVITVDSNFNRFGLNQSSGQHVCVVFFEHVHIIVGTNRPPLPAKMAALPFFYVLNNRYLKHRGLFEKIT